MTKHDLKELAAMGAELGAAKAENDRLRGLVRRYVDLFADVRLAGQAKLLDAEARAALSKQAEPTDTYTAVDMATAAAQGFRDGQAAVEPAPAQDEREAFEAHMRLGGYSNPEKHQDGSYVSSAMELWWQGWKARATRPAQTEKQHPDDAAVDRFAAAMKAKLAKSRAKGRGGWDDPNVCSVEFLAQLLVEHLGKGNTGTFEDVANFAMMLHQRGADPKVLAESAAQQPQQSALVEAAQGALTEIQAALEDAYLNAYPECCGQAHLECCGSPLQAWSEADQKTMERFTPHERALRAALSAQGAVNE